MYAKTDSLYQTCNSIGNSSSCQGFFETFQILPGPRDFHLKFTILSICLIPQLPWDTIGLYLNLMKNQDTNLLDSHKSYLFSKSELCQLPQRHGNFSLPTCLFFSDKRSPTNDVILWLTDTHLSIIYKVCMSHIFQQFHLASQFWQHLLFVAHSILLLDQQTVF